MDDSSEISAQIRRNRNVHNAWFSLADKLSKSALLRSKEIVFPNSNDVDLVAALLFMRGVSSFQAAIVLAERGFAAEARTLVRGCFETAFYMGALYNDPAFLDDMVRDDADRRGKLARALMELPDESALEARQVEMLRRFDESVRMSGIRPKRIGIIDVAKRAGLEEIYHTYYRGLSNDASHPSIISLNRYVEVDGELTGLRWRRDATGIDDTVNNICTAAIYIVYFANCLFAHGDSTAEFTRCWADYEALVDHASQATEN